MSFRQITLRYRDGSEEQIGFVGEAALDRLKIAWSKGQELFKVDLRPSERGRDISTNVRLGKVIEIVQGPEIPSSRTMSPQKSIVEGEFDEEDGANTFEM